MANGNSGADDYFPRYLNEYNFYLKEKNQMVRYFYRKVYDLFFSLLNWFPFGVTIIIKSKKCGFFGDLCQTLNAIRFAEICGMNCEVDWNKESLYFDKAYGQNVWEYYFHTSKFFFSTKKNHYLRIPYYPSAYDITVYQSLSVKESVALAISKFCRLKQEISDFIDSYVRLNFADHVLGVHFRGTDVAAGFDNRSSLQLDQVILQIDEFIKINKDANVFVATDDFNAIKKLDENFGSLINYRDCIRSSNGNSIHGHYDEGLAGSGFQKGFDVLIDAYLLSECDSLIYKGSRVMWFASGVRLGREQFDLC